MTQVKFVVSSETHKQIARVSVETGLTRPVVYARMIEALTGENSLSSLVNLVREPGDYAPVILLYSHAADARQDGG